MAQKKRALFIDLLRGSVLLIMIEVHVFNTMLITSIKEAGWYSYLNFINGLVAPSFLFVSGLVFVLSLQNSTDELRKFGKVFWKKMGRIALIFLAGYSLHLPYFSLKKIISHASPQILNSLFLVDVLQCIAAGLLFLMIARMIFKNENQFYLFVLICLIVVLTISPIAWKTELTQFLPIPIASYFNTMNGSLFPVLPWFNFIFAGALTSKFYIKAREKNEEKIFIKILLLIGTVFFVGGLVLYQFIPIPILKNILPNPFFLVERLGVVFLLLAACWYYLEKSTKHVGFILDVSRESLLVYWLHLQLIYRNLIGGKSAASIWGNHLTLFEAVLVTIILATLMILAAKGWGWVKATYPVWAKRIVTAGVSISLLIFIFF